MSRGWPCDEHRLPADRDIAVAVLAPERTGLESEPDIDPRRERRVVADPQDRVELGEPREVRHDAAPVAEPGEQVVVRDEVRRVDDPELAVQVERAEVLPARRWVEPDPRAEPQRRL